MDLSIPDPAKLGLMPDAVKASEATVAGLDLASILEAVQVRASAPTPVMEQNLQLRPSSHWGINE